MQDLRISAIQSELHWENPEANFKMFEEWIDIAPDSDLILLPEMFTTGFSMNPSGIKLPSQNQITDWMLEQAVKQSAVISGSTIVKEEENYYNRLLWVSPDGQVKSYDKKHLFSLASEETVYQPGEKLIQTEINGWKIRPLICYDLRFPVWCRNTDAYDVLLFVANWPQRRIAHWNKLLLARAIENQSYVCAVNRCGFDGNKVYHNGDSSIITPNGELVDKISDREGILHAKLEYSQIETYRKYLSALKDADPFEFT